VAVHDGGVHLMALKHLGIFERLRVRRTHADEEHGQKAH
jgi:hypothetical protein